MVNLTLSMNEKWQHMLDIEEIRQLRINYSHCLDSNNIDGLEQIFSIDATVKVTVGEMTGVNEIKLGLTEAVKLFDQLNKGKYPFIHAITNHAITLIDNDHAMGQCYLLDFEISKQVNKTPLFLIGLYHDSYERINGKWRIVKSTLDSLWEKET